MKNSIIYSCPFVPAELIAAHGLSPRRIAPSCRRSMLGPAPGVCPYASAFITEAIASDQAAAVVVTTVCDQMRRAADAIARRCSIPVFLMNVPHTWQTSAAHRLYLEELKRLSRFLERVGGVCFTSDSLAEIMADYDTARASIRDSRGLLSPACYSERIASFHRGDLNTPAHYIAAEPSGVPVALIGGPLSELSFGIFDLIEKAGGYVALDATETGERTLPAPFDRRRLRDDSLTLLADAYFGSIPDPFRRPNSEFYKWLKQSIADRGIRGIILRRYLWCDNWHAEAQRIRDWSGLPFLHIDVGDEDDHSARTVSRLQSFMEMLT